MFQSSYMSEASAIIACSQWHGSATDLRNFSISACQLPKQPLDNHEGDALVQHLQASRKLEERQLVLSAGPAVHVPSGGNASVLERPGSRQPFRLQHGAM
jgi:hypothetical protein